VFSKGVAMKPNPFQREIIPLTPLTPMRPFPTETRPAR